MFVVGTGGVRVPYRSVIIITYRLSDFVCGNGGRVSSAIITIDSSVKTPVTDVNNCISYSFWDSLDNFGQYYMHKWPCLASSIHDLKFHTFGALLSDQ